ncbi:MAG: RNA polymerase factor sigma-54 [Deltaproteobacteria bacterium]|nr:RNA polymerase factor sigma-54 [Deltaproteobacteria bacterium]
MALELRQSLNLTQRLVLTPKLQHAIKLLQLSRLELLDSINEEMETNPALEELAAGEGEEEGEAGDEKEDLDEDASDLPEVTVEERARDDVDWENYLSEYNTGWAEPRSGESDSPTIESITPAVTNLHSHLMWQLSVSNLEEKQREIGVHIIGNLNDDGYLDVPLKEIKKTTGYPLKDIRETLRLVQNFDPVGIAGRDARESLLIQAEFHGLGGTIVEKIIKYHMGDLEKRKYEKIAKGTSASVEKVLTAVSVLRGLSPKPGRIYSDDRTVYIIPDIYVYKVGDDYEIVMNEDGLPKLRVSNYYREMLRGSSTVSENAREYLHEKLKSAAWLIKSIHQRQRTIYRVTKSIVQLQRAFLDEGITKIKPLILRDVANDIGMHESTVSRVTANKYVHTPQGVFEFKFFFNSSIGSVDGDSVASGSVKESIRNMIKSENSAKPYSDQAITDILMKSNIDIARRTVAKYRESMGILPSWGRKNAF